MTFVLGNHKFYLKLVLVFLLSSLILACASRTTNSNLKVKSPLGLYKSNAEKKYWIAILENNRYLLCSTKVCQPGVYQKVPAHYGIILIDFYQLEIGLAIEKLSHGVSATPDYLRAMKEIRETAHRANDQVFNIGDCDGTPCVGIGHRRAGIKFYKIEDFDAFW